MPSHLKLQESHHSTFLDIYLEEVKEISKCALSDKGLDTAGCAIVLKPLNQVEFGIIEEMTHV